MADKKTIRMITLFQFNDGTWEAADHERERTSRSTTRFGLRNRLIQASRTEIVEFVAKTLGKGDCG